MGRVAKGRRGAKVAAYGRIAGGSTGFFLSGLQILDICFVFDTMAHPCRGTTHFPEVWHVVQHNLSRRILGARPGEGQGVLRSAFRLDVPGYGRHVRGLPDGRGQPGGGFSNHEGGKPGGSPCVYILVKEIEDYTGKIAELGGRVSMPKTEIPNIGWSAIFEDPFGNSVGLFQSAMQEG